MNEKDRLKFYEGCALCKIGDKKHTHKAFYAYDVPFKPIRKKLIRKKRSG